jgi:hypothetical protein
LALIEANRKIECALIEESDAAAFRLKAGDASSAYRLIYGAGHRAIGGFCPAAAPDILCNMTVTCSRCTWVAMAELFLGAFAACTGSGPKVRAMTPERRAKMFAELSDDAADEWMFAAGDSQLIDFDATINARVRGRALDFEGPRRLARRHLRCTGPEATQAINHKLRFYTLALELARLEDRQKTGDCRSGLSKCPKAPTIGQA